MGESRAGIVYRGPSMIDGAPIVVVAVYSDRNRKTGAMLQTYVILADVNPLDASKNGADFSICGDCKHRGTVTDDAAARQAKGRSCYVILGQGPLSVYRGMQRGLYPDAQSSDARRALGRGRLVRIGTYGDPGAVPADVWQDLIADAAGWTAYTHRAGWRPDLAMQSADTLAEAQGHWQAGRRTFRVMTGLADLVPEKEVLCPASKEAGRRTTCAACKLCAGTATRSPKSVAIVIH